MPIAYEVTLYGCRFKCRGRRSQNKKLIEKHEETCFANPDRRACRTCKHDYKEAHPDECRCLIESNHRPFTLDPDAPGRITCCADCPDWEPKP